MILGYQMKERTKNEKKVGKNKQLSYLSAHAYHIKWLLGSPTVEMLGVNANKAECLIIYHKINHWLCSKFLWLYNVFVVCVIDASVWN